MNDQLFDFDSQADGARSLKRIAQAMLRAGQPVVSSELDAKVRRTAGVSYRTALLTLASGQMITLLVKLTGDVYQVKLNGQVLPIKSQDGLKAVAEIAAAAERNQAKFQAAQARKKVELPKSIRTAAPRIAQALDARNAELDAQIAERTETRDALLAELGDAALDAVEVKQHPARTDSKDRTKPSWDSHDWPQMYQNNDGNWHGVRDGWNIADHVHEDFKEGRVVSLLASDGEFIKYGESNADWEKSMERRPVPDLDLVPQPAELVGTLDDTAPEPDEVPAAQPDAPESLVPEKTQQPAEGEVSDEPKPAPVEPQVAEPIEQVPDVDLVPAPVELVPSLDGAKEWSEEHQAALDQALRIVDGEMLDAADLGGAISTLKIALDVVETNHPLNVAAGNLDQADLEARNAVSLRAGISLLEGRALDDAGRQEPAAEPEANATV